jgi:magnesium-protoporphyrin IX monomethyl ester (oxidative) cyclase
MFTLQSESVLNVASALKAADGKIVTVVGGHDATVRAQEWLLQSNVDFVVRGEGEYSMLEIVEALESGRQDRFSQILGICYKEQGTLKFTGSRPPIRNLDNLPNPARHLLPMENYFKASSALREGWTKAGLGRRVANVISSRGCPWGCVFCSVRLVMGRGWRPRDPEKVVKELKDLKTQYGVNYVVFDDDNMTLDRKRMMRICDLLIEEGLNLKWGVPNGVRADSLDEELLLQMKKSGCDFIALAPESGNQHVVDEIIRKRQDLRKVEEAVRICRRIGIRVDCFYIIGLIGETREDIIDTIRFARKLSKLGGNASFHIALPFPGTELEDQARIMGFLKEEDGRECGALVRQGYSRIATPELPCSEVERLYLEATKINPLITLESMRMAWRVLITDPIRFVRLLKTFLMGQRLAG